MEGFYIEDYIWLIVLGVFLLFVIIGFIADKTGLARKTFGKVPSSDRKKEKKSKKEVKEKQDDVVENQSSTENAESDSLGMPMIDTLTSNEALNEALSDNSINQDLYLSDDSNLTENSFDDNSVIDADSVDNSGNSSTSDELNIHLGEENGEIYLNQDDSTDDVPDNLNPELTVSNDDDLYQPMGNISFDKDKNSAEVEISETEEEPSQDDDVWKLDDKKETEEENLPLPDLEDVSTNADEDVWKF